MKKILSCIPIQKKDYLSKLNWLEKVLEKNNVDILVTPQEYFGGASMMEDNMSFTEEQIIIDIKNLCKKYDTAIILGVEEKVKNINKESIWFIEKTGEIKGKLNKFALPKYDHIVTKGYGNIVPELNFEKRFEIIELEGIRFSAVFCWEVFSNILWTGISLQKPDIVLNMIKFGVNAWPVLEKSNKRKMRIKDFGYGHWEKEKDNIWIERLKFANKYQVFCPILCATNSWNLRPISLPLVGCISQIPGQVESQSFWRPKKEMGLKKIPEKIIIDNIDVNKIRESIKNKYSYKEKTGSWPPWDLMEYTMLFKMARIENRIKSGKEKEKVIRALLR